MNRPRRKQLGPDPPARWVGTVVSPAAVGLITALIDPLRQVWSGGSDAVLYLPAVLLVAACFGLWLGLLSSATDSGPRSAGPTRGRANR